MSLTPLRLKPGSDLRASLEEAAGSTGCAFVVTGIGSLQGYKLRFAQEEVESDGSEPVEILTLAGSVAINGAHLHMSVSDRHGAVIGGHVCYGNIVRTTVEVLLSQVPEWRLSREFDSQTGYQELVVRAAGHGDKSAA